ncbi:MAG: prolyl oligopeptidase family serine peptidase [Blastocatellia bacterium]
MSGARILFMLMAIILLSIGVSARSRNTETGFLNRTVKVGAETYTYQVYVPANWTKAKKWPIILFLHGAGERGNDGLIQTEVGIGTLIRRHPDRIPAIVVMPQCATNHWWLQPEMQAQALKALEQSMKEFNGDQTRTYLTGLSMGGNGTWAIASANPGKFAAIAPVCAPARISPRYGVQVNPEDMSEERYKTYAAKIGRTPVWVFHGDADPVVPVTESRLMVEALKAASGDVRYNEYPGVGHDSWNKAYAEPELFTWLFSHQLDSNAKAKR